MKLGGVMPPITTPFRDGKLAFNKLKNNFQKWNKTDLSGYLVLGSNGESVYLNEKGKIKVVEVSRASIPQSKIMMGGDRNGIHSGDDPLYQSSGQDRCGLCPRHYSFLFQGVDEATDLVRHFVAVAESSKIGILAYNVPQFTGMNLEPEWVAKLSEHSNIIGIKDSSGNIGQLSEIIYLSEKGFAVFTGSAPVFFPALCVGAVGGILAVANTGFKAFLRKGR